MVQSGRNASRPEMSILGIFIAASGLPWNHLESNCNKRNSPIPWSAWPWRKTYLHDFTHDQISDYRTIPLSVSVFHDVYLDSRHDQIPRPPFFFWGEPWGPKFDAMKQRCQVFSCFLQPLPATWTILAGRWDQDGVAKIQACFIVVVQLWKWGTPNFQRITMDLYIYILYILYIYIYIHLYIYIYILIYILPFPIELFDMAISGIPNLWQQQTHIADDIPVYLHNTPTTGFIPHSIGTTSSF